VNTNPLDEPVTVKTLKHRTIPFFNYPDLFARDEKELMQVVRDVLARGAYIMQRDLTEFESRLAAYLGVKHVLGVADGTNALVMAVKVLGLEPGDEVIVPSHTFVASAAAIHHAGAKPVLVDCGRDHLIDPRSVERAVTSRTRAIMPVQLNGRTADMTALQSIADTHGLSIIEDSCQALGSKFRDRYAGTFGVAGTFSFYPSKTLGAFGDGGAFVTNDDKVAEYATLLRDHGRSESGDVVLFGYNARLDNLQAAVLNFKLDRYEDEIRRRRQIALIYDEILRDIDDLILPPAPGADPQHFDIFQNYEIESGRRDALRVYLEQNGIKTILQWGGKTIHQFGKLGLNIDLPNTDRMTERFMLLPMNTSLADDDVHYVAEQVRRFYGLRA
jgi:dTDP-4-amino-4,6-dideoxygalactose transaminase